MKTIKLILREKIPTYTINKWRKFRYKNFNIIIELQQTQVSKIKEQCFDNKSKISVDKTRKIFTKIIQVNEAICEYP